MALKWILVAALVLAVQGKPQSPNALTDQYQYDASDYNYDDGDGDMLGEEEEKEIGYDINFQNRGSTHTVDKGTTIRLPCYVDQFPENYVIMWKKVDDSADDFLALGKNVIKNTNRISVELNRDGANKGSTLVIGLAEDSDAGQYVCQLGTNEPKEIKHTVQVRDPPSITKNPSNGLTKAKKGDDVVLSCIGKGSPLPTITWSRLNAKLPDGRDTIEASELNFKNVNRHHAGTYVCTANNGFGREVKEKIHLDVDYSPEIEVEEVFIHAKEANEVELVCLVHAHPQATVQWFKTDVELTGDDIMVERHGHRHTLTIPSVTTKDYGNYTCRAKNMIGEQSKILEISGLAGFADFKSASRGQEPNSFLLEWTSESYTTIEEFELIWREDGGSWEGFSVPSHQINAFNWAGKHSFSGLNVATRYEARVTAKNEEGWSRPSPSYHFATFGAEPLKETNSATQPRISMLCISTALFVILISKLL
jgi:hypothetical protein